MTEKFSYDVVAYPSYVFPQTAPQRISAVARFHGIDAAAANDCRYLDLGCGDGANLLLHAYDNPDSSFVGIDLSEPRIIEARAYAREIGLSNVEFIHGDVSDMNRVSNGEFDFIVAHGLYSWVPEEVRTKIRSLYRECLSESGVGYISYNAYPGCHIREMVWHMMRSAINDDMEPSEKVDAGVRSIASFRDATGNPILKALLNVELEQLLTRNPENIFHDDLSGCNRPFYFQEFVRDIEADGMQFLAEIDSLAVSGVSLSEEELSLIASLGTGRTRREQYADMLRMSRFRSSLVCRSEHTVMEAPDGEMLRGLHLFTDVRIANSEPDLTEGTSQRFVTTRGGEVEAATTLAKTALIRLAGIHPQSMSLEDLLGSSGAAGISEQAWNSAANELAGLVRTGAVKLRLGPSPHTLEPGEFPAASRFARWQADHGFDSITSLAGFNFEPEDRGLLELVKILDGSRDRAALAAEMASLYDVPASEKEEFEKKMPGIVESQINDLARAAYLIS